jgi:hypothetical protein
MLLVKSFRQINKEPFSFRVKGKCGDLIFGNKKKGPRLVAIRFKINTELPVTFSDKEDQIKIDTVVSFYLYGITICRENDFSRAEKRAMPTKVRHRIWRWVTALWEG